jgi:hypothetical protein
VVVGAGGIIETRASLAGGPALPARPVFGCGVGWVFGAVADLDEPGADGSGGVPDGGAVRTGATGFTLASAGLPLRFEMISQPPTSSAAIAAAPAAIRPDVR